MNLDARYEILRGIVRDLGSVAIGFSGGADSALLVKVAADLLGAGAVAVTAVSGSYPQRDLRQAQGLAAEIGVRHLLIESREFDEPGYIANEPNRCFFCKQELFEILKDVAHRENLRSFAYGAITDDLGDFRPGMDAARAAGARAPLLEAGLSKDDIRELSRRLNLPTWNRPASACLSSRIPHGTPIDPAELKRVERAEDFLLARGFRQVRVRAHHELARVEAGVEELPRLVEPAFRREFVEHLRQLGFRYVTVDLEGYRTGSLNPLIAIGPSSTTSGDD